MRWNLYDIGNSKGIYIYGAGEYGKYIFDILKTFPLNIEGFIDSFYKGEKVRSLPVYNEIISKEDYEYVVAVSRRDDKIEIIDRLLSAGIDENSIFVPMVPKGNRFFDPAIMNDTRLYELLLHVQLDYYICMGDESLEEFFLCNEIYRVAVCGRDNLVRLLQEKLRGCKVAASPYKAMNDYDAVVVMDSPNFAEIEEKIMEQVNVPILNIWNLIGSR